MKNYLMMFVGTECPHCDAMRPLVAKLVFETGAVVEERDVWKSERDMRMLENYRADIIKSDAPSPKASAAHSPKCDGIPFFYNTKTKQYLCGEVNFKQLKKWAI